MEKLKISLAAARVNAGLTQKQAAEALGVRTETICAWETHKTSMSVDMALKIAELYNLPIDCISFGFESN